MTFSHHTAQAFYNPFSIGQQQFFLNLNLFCRSWKYPLSRNGFICNFKGTCLWILVSDRSSSSLFSVWKFQRLVLLCFQYLLAIHFWDLLGWRLFAHLLNSLGCIGSTYQLFSDFTPIGKDTFSQVNDSNILVLYNCEQQKINLNLENKLTIRGNITNIGSNTILRPEVTASFFMKNGIAPEFSNNNVKSDYILCIDPNETVNFTISKKYPNINIESYIITVLY